MTGHRLLRIQELWGLTEEPVFHRFVANDIYFSRIKDLEVVIRITPSTQRTVSEIQAELDWINYLNRNSVQVCETVRSFSLKEIETVEDEGKTFHCVVFKKIEGERVTKELMKVEHIQLGHNKWPRCMTWPKLFAQDEISEKNGMKILYF